MLEVDMKTTIKTLYQKGYNKTQIGRMLDIDRKTVRKVLKDDAGRKETGQGSAWPSMLDAYREYIEIQLGKELSITRIHQDLQKEFGVECGYTTLRDYVAKLRKNTPHAYMVLHSLPGEEAQVDFGYIGTLKVNGRPRKAWVFIMSLSNFYLYDPAGNVAGITDQDGYLWQSYRYDAFGNATFGSPQYDNEYTFNGESYNPNIQSQYLRARYYDTVKGSFLTEDTYLGDIRNPLTLNRHSYCIGNPLHYRDPSGHDPRPIRLYYDSEIVKDYKKIWDYANNTLKGDDKVDWYKEYRKMVTFYQALQYTSEYQYSAEDVIDYEFGYDTIYGQNYMDNLIGEAHYLQMMELCRRDEAGTPILEKTFEGWLDLYSIPTVNQHGRLVKIPWGRPRGEGTSWKSYEAKYEKEHGYINEYAYGVVKDQWKFEDENNKLGMIRSVDENGINRYWVAVGPRVMTPNYSTVKGKEIPLDVMKYGTKIDVIIRDSNFNVYYVPAIVGDAKEHTYGNGIYQTGFSWKSQEDEASEDSDSAVIEFIRKPPVAEGDRLINTPEFDILGIIVYD